MAESSGGPQTEQGRQTKSVTDGSSSTSCVEPPVCQLTGNIVDVLKRRIFTGVLTVADGRIVSVQRDDSVRSVPFILPGLVDAHAHIESTFLCSRHGF